MFKIPLSINQKLGTLKSHEIFAKRNEKRQLVFKIDYY